MSETIATVVGVVVGAIVSAVLGAVVQRRQERRHARLRRQATLADCEKRVRAIAGAVARGGTLSAVDPSRVADDEVWNLGREYDEFVHAVADPSVRHEADDEIVAGLRSLLVLHDSGALDGLLAALDRGRAPGEGSAG